MKGFFASALLLSVFCLAASAQAPKPHYHIASFDWDDNLLSTPAKLWLDELLPNNQWTPIAVSSRQWAQIREDPGWKARYRPSQYRYFLGDYSDIGGDDTFVNQVAEACKNISTTQGGALPLLKYHLTNGFPISIVTARSHAGRNIAAGLRYFVSPDAGVFSPSEYQSMIGAFQSFFLPRVAGFNKFYLQEGALLSFPDKVVEAITASAFCVAVNEPVWLRQHGNCRTATCKGMALLEIVDHQFKMKNDTLFADPMVVSFSDDDAENVKSITAALKDVVYPKYPTACLRVYDTHDPKNVIITHLTPACDKIVRDVIPRHFKRVKRHF